MTQGDCSVDLRCDDFGTQTCIVGLPEGSPCASEAECDVGLRCLGGFSACTVGSLANGGTCFSEIECDVGLRCDSGSCVVGGQFGDACSTFNACDPSLRCLPDTDTDICKDPLVLGASCNILEQENECGPQLICDFPPGVTPGPGEPTECVWEPF
jgi:hypothetical protein